MTVFTISTAKVIKTSILRITAGPKIGEKFDMSAADAEKKFENVRTGYGGYLKKVKAIPSGFGRDVVPTPKDFAGLEWLQKYISHRPTVSNMNPVKADSDEDDNSVSEQGETNKKNKNPATAAIIWKHRIAAIAQNKTFVSNTFFDDSSDGSDYMETGLTEFST